MKSTFTPAVAPVAAVAEVEGSEARLTLDISMTEAAQLRALLVRTAGEELYEVYAACAAACAATNEPKWALSSRDGSVPSTLRITLKAI